MSNIDKFEEQCKFNCRVLMLRAELTEECKLKIQMQMKALLEVVRDETKLLVSLQAEAHETVCKNSITCYCQTSAIGEVLNGLEAKFGELLK